MGSSVFTQGTISVSDDCIVYIEYTDISNYSYAIRCRSNQITSNGYTVLASCDNLYTYRHYYRRQFVC